MLRQTEVCHLNPVTRCALYVSYNRYGVANRSVVTFLSGLPGGNRSAAAQFLRFPQYGNWWSSTEVNASSAWYRSLVYNEGFVYRPGADKRYGYSVRCMKD